MSLLLDSSLRVGSVITFSYPTDNRVKVSTRLVHRQCLIRSIRDIELRPLHAITFERRPDLRRSRYLIRGEDIECKQWRSFYEGSARSIRTLDIPLRRLAYFDPCVERATLYWFGTVYTDSRFDRAVMADVVSHCNKVAANARRKPYLVVRPFPLGARHADDSRSRS